MTREKRSSILITFVLAVFFLIACSGMAMAELTTYTMVLNDTYLQNNIQDGNNDVHAYQVTLPSAGTLTVTYQGWSIKDGYYQLQNGSQDKEFFKHEVYYSSDVDPKTSSDSRILEKGNYLIRVWSYGSNKGMYKIKASFKAAGNNETEPNNSFDTGMTLRASTTVTGLISSNDTYDFYKFTVPSTQDITLTYNGRIKDSYYSIYDSEFNQIKKKEVYYGSEESPKTDVYTANLKAGVYYIKIEPYSSNTGRYSLKWEGTNIPASTATPATPSTPSPSPTPSTPSAPTSTPVPASSAPQKIESTDKIIKGSGTGKVVFIDFLGTKIIKGKKVSLGSKTKILPADAANKKVQWISSNPDVATVSSSGVVTAKSCGRVYITAIAADGGGASTTRTFYVRPKKMSKASVSSPGKKRIRVKWKKVSGVSKYQIAISKLKNFSKRTMKNMKQSKKSYTFTSMKSGQVYYVRMRATYKVNSKKTLYGPWSTAVKIKCK